MAFGRSSHHSLSSKPAPAIGTPPNPGIARYASDYTRYVEGLGLTLTPSQDRFIRAFFTGANLCCVGIAGSGKSFLMRTLFGFLDSVGLSAGRTATTGVSAFAIGGQTIHSWAGLGLADEDVATIITKVAKNSRAKNRIKAATILFLDEVSMAKGDLLNKLDQVLRYVRRDTTPWGGLQVVLIGDPLQLPAIHRGDEVQTFFFQCQAWREGGFKTVVLKEAMRQREGDPFLTVLNDIRVGKTDSLHVLEDRIDATFPSDGIEPVRLFCKNVDVDRHNAQRLAALPGEVKTYHAKDHGTEYQIETLNKNCPAAKTLDLKVGAQVVLLTNESVEDGLCNGSTGVITAFGPLGVTVKFPHIKAVIGLKEWTIKEQEPGVDGKIRYKTVASRTQMPLRACWATSIHKSQGQTLDRVIVDLRETFGTSLAYVALSRVRDMGSLSIVGGVPAEAIRVNPDCAAFYRDAERE